MAPSPEEVEHFMAAAKVVPALQVSGDPRKMEWEVMAADRVMWRSGVEVAAARVGQLFLFVNPQPVRSWMFKLSLHGVEVFRWDAKPDICSHKNPPQGCPEGFGGRVRDPNHEHVWVDGLDCHCARPIGDGDLSTHERMFRAFCDRTNLTCEPTYQTPPAQLTL